MKKTKQFISFATKQEELNGAIYSFKKDVLDKVEMTEVQKINTDTFLRNLIIILNMK